VLKLLVYVSAAVELLSTAELAALLQSSRANNLRDGLTGVLLYKAGDFMQAVEGPADKVEALHARLLRDRRHRGLRVLVEQAAEERLFPGWSMASGPSARALSSSWEGRDDDGRPPVESLLGRPPGAVRDLLLAFMNVPAEKPANR